MSRALDVDLCIIGAGSGGLSMAAGAAQLGRKVALIEKGAMGGDCLNVGCVPSKALIAAGKRAQDMRTASKFGVRAVEPEIDFAAVMDHVRAVIASIAPHDSQERFEGLGVTVLREHGRFVGERSVEAGETRVNAKHLVIATGSRPFVPPIKGLETTPYLTNETLFENRERPSRLIIMGGGPIGVEMAQAHARLGAAVTIVEGETILNRDEPELVEIVRAQLSSEGVDIIENARVEACESRGDGVAVFAGGRWIEGSHLLVAVGREPTTDDLGIAAAGVGATNKGVEVDASLKTANGRVYAMGDVTGGRQFTHVAGYHASVLIKKILFKAPAKNEDAKAPAVTYSDPEIARFGLTENEARERYGDGARAVVWSAEENDRAQTERDTRGMVKVVTDKKGAILGASIVGAQAGDLIQPLLLAYANGRRIKDFTDMIAPYPTRGEMAKRAAGAWYAPSLFSDRTRKIVSLLASFD